MDIHKGLANANKLGNRVVLEALDHVDLRVASIQGGGLRNAIPRESKTTWCLSAQRGPLGLGIGLDGKPATRLNAEYATTDPELDLTVEWSSVRVAEPRDG